MRAGGLPAGCLPSRVSGGDVYLIDVGDDRLGEPLYQLSLARLCAEDPVRVRLPLRSLEVLADEEALPGPRGLIFHTGRCGSTLLANMLGAHPAARMIHEAEALNQSLIDHARLGGGAPAVRAVVRAFGRGLPPAGALLVKTSTWNVAELRALLAAFPGASAVFLWRPAAEVVASCLDVPSPWQKWQGDPAARERWLPGDPRTPADPADLAQFYANAWRVSAAAALGARREFGDRLKIVSYAELRADPAATAAAAARHFRLPVTPGLTDHMAAKAAGYSKNPAARFDPAGTHARRQLSAGQLAAVQRITAELESRLRQA